jgi:ceramide glucosyltransferase
LFFAAAPTVFSAFTWSLMMGTCAAQVRRARQTAPDPIDRAPRISILKPLAGADDELATNLASFAAIDYPSYEILLGVASTTDAAYPVARDFVKAHPDRARLVLTDPDAAVNPKVAQLIGLDARATGDVVVVSDSNVRVDRSYLWSLARPLSEPGVGLVTSLFVGSGEQTLGAALENLQLGASSAPGIVATNTLTPWPLTIGKSMAMRRRDLVQLGGFARFGGLLAEDQVMGRTFSLAGYGVRTSLHAVHNRNVTCTLKRTLERHTRWAKLRRSLHPSGFFFEPLLSPLTVATLVAVIDPSRTTLGIAGAVAVAQTLITLAMVRLLRGTWLAWRYAPLEVVRTCLAFYCWAVAWMSMRIAWRGHAMVLRRGSVIAPLLPGANGPLSARGAWATLRARFARA